MEYSKTGYENDSDEQLIAGIQAHRHLLGLIYAEAHHRLQTQPRLVGATHDATIGTGEREPRSENWISVKKR